MKKTFTKLMSLLLSVIMMLTMGIGAFAADEVTGGDEGLEEVKTPTFTVESVTAEAGGTVEVDVMVSDNSGFDSFRFYLTYDATLLKYKDKANAELLTGRKLAHTEKTTENVTTLGFLLMESTGESSVTENGVLFTVIFDVTTGSVDSAVAAVEASLGTNGYVKTKAGETVDFAFVGGELTIKPFAEFAISSGETNVGDKVTLSVTAKNNPGITSFSVYVKYDKEIFSPAASPIVRGSGIAVENGKLSYALLTAEDGSGLIRVTWSNSTSKITEDGARLFNVVFTTATNLTENISTVELSKESDGYINYAADTAVEEVNFTDGKVSIYEYTPAFNFKVSSHDDVRDNKAVTVIVSVDMDERDKGFNEFTLNLEYDSSKLTPQMITTFKTDKDGNTTDLPIAGLGKVSSNIKQNPNGKLVIRWEKSDKTQNYTTEGAVFEITFYVTDNAPDGKTDLKLSVANVKSEGAKNSTATAESGYIEIQNKDASFWDKIVATWNNLIAAFSGLMTLSEFFKSLSTIWG